jgi:hypothetical protein
MVEKSLKGVIFYLSHFFTSHIVDNGILKLVTIIEFLLNIFIFTTTLGFYHFFQICDFLNNSLTVVPA